MSPTRSRGVGSTARRRRESLAPDPTLFLEVLSHELRTPLSTILMQAQLLARGVLDDAGIRQASEAIRRAVQTQVKLIDGLLDASRFLAGEAPLALQTVDPSPVVRESVEAVLAQAQDKSVSIETSVGDVPERLAADPARLREALVYLVINGVKLARPGGRVTIEFEAAERHGRIRVSNTGVGIRRDLVPAVLDPLRRRSLARDTAWGGLGLRLGIVRSLVERQGGKVEMESEGEGRGARFTIMMPLAAAGAGTRGSPASPDARAARAK